MGVYIDASNCSKGLAQDSFVQMLENKYLLSSAFTELPKDRKLFGGKGRAKEYVLLEAIYA